MWEHFHHQADIGIRGTGETLDQAFAEGAMALTAVVCDPLKVQAAECVEIICQGDDPEYLFFDWISAIIYEMDIRKMLFGRFEVTIDGSQLRAKAWGESIDADRHDIAVEVKAATFMLLKVYQDPEERWVTQCVVDV